MKALKIILVSLVGLLVLLLVLVLVLSLPPVQRGIALAMIGVGDEREAEIEYVRLHWSGLSAHEVTIREHGESYRLEELDARFSPWDLVFRRELRVGHLRAENVLIDLSQSVREPQEEPYEGIFKGLDFDLPMWIDDVALSGQLLLPGGERPLTVDCSVSGGGIAPGERGVLTIDARAHDPAAAILASAIDFSGELTLSQQEEGGFDRVELAGGVVAAGRALGWDQSVSFTLAMAKEENSAVTEVYSADIYHGEPRNPDERVIAVRGELDPATRHLSGSWDLSIGSQHLAGLVAEQRLPAFAATGSGAFAYAFGTGAFGAEGELDGRLAEPEMLAPGANGVGPVFLAARFDIGFQEETLRLEELEVEAGRQDEPAFLLVRNFEPMRYDFAQQDLFGAEDRVRLASVQIREVPAPWLLAAAPEGLEDWAIEHGAVSGELEVGVEGVRVFFETAEPLVAQDFTISEAGEALLQGVDLRLSGSGSMRRDGSARTGQLQELVLQENGVELLRASGQFADAEQQASGEVEVNLGALARQPMFAPIRAVQAGVVRADGTADWQERLRVSGQARLRDGIAGAEEARLPSVEAQWELEAIGEDRWQINLPIEVELAGEISDVSLTGQLGMGEATDLDLDATGQLLRVEDLMGFAQIFDAEPEVADAPPDGPVEEPERDDAPVWIGVAGRIGVRFEQMVLPGDQRVREVDGELNIAEERVEVRADATALDSPMALSATLGFNESEERPYQLSGEVQAPQLDLGALFRQAETGEPPTVEGMFAISARFEADGVNLAELTERLRGRFSLESDGGSYRMLRSDSPLGDLGTMFGGILGSREGNVGAEIGRLTQALSNIRYDQLRLEIERGEELNILLEDLMVQAPELLLRGNGIVRHRENVPLLQQPMMIELDLGARGGLENLLDTLSAMGPEPEEEGAYRPLRQPFRITGTPARPNPNELYQMIARSALRRVLPDEEAETEEGEASEEQPPRPEGLEIIEEILRRIQR